MMGSVTILVFSHDYTREHSPHFSPTLQVDIPKECPFLLAVDQKASWLDLMTSCSKYELLERSTRSSFIMG